MKKMGILLMPVIILILCVGCSQNDPFEDMWTTNIYPALNDTYDIGSSSLWYENGYFTNLFATSLNISGNITAHNFVLSLSKIDDIRIVPGSFDRPGTSDPAYIAYNPNGGAITTYLTEWQIDDIASFTVQMPHGYTIGTNISVHVHWTPGARGVAENGHTVGWKVDYTWANIDGAFGNMATASLTDTCDGTNHKHLMTPEVVIAGAGKGISSMLICNIKRTDTGADDTWATNTAGNMPMLLEVDFHFEVDTLGSYSPTEK